MHTASRYPCTRPAHRALLGLLLAFTLTGCARYAVTDYDAGADFDSYEQYRFAEQEEGTVQSLDATRIERALTRELEKAGLTRTDVESEADLIVRYRIDRETRIESRGPNFGFGLGFGRNPFTFGMAHSPVQSREISEGQLIVEFIEPNAKQVVWQGRAEQNLTESMSPDRRNELIERVVEAMFEQYPPERAR